MSSSCVHDVTCCLGGVIATEVALDVREVTPLGLGLGKLSIPMAVFSDGHLLVNPIVVLMCFHDAFQFAIGFGLIGTFFAEVLVSSVSCDV